MRQSLQASKVAQTMKRAEEELERERVLSVLKRSRAGSASRGGGGGRSPMQGDEAGPESYGEPSSNVPPLPRRRLNQVPSPPPSSSTMSSSTGSSTEHVETKSLDRCWDAHDKRPFPTSAPRPTLPFTPKSHFSSRPLPIPGQSSRIGSPERSLVIDSPLSSPTHHPTDPVHLQQSSSSQVPPPPTHPDRKHLTAHSSSTDSFDMIYPDPDQPRAELASTPDSHPNQPRMSRSKSLHHPSPPLPPPPRRKRPESVQITPTSDSRRHDHADTTTTTTDDPTYDSHFHDSPSPSRRRTRLSRNLSLSVERDASASPLTNIQRTIAKLDALQPRLASGLESLQPKLDRARYKAEAGLSWRGYLHHHGLAGNREEEGEKGLVRDRTGDGSVASSASSASEGEIPKEGEGELERDELKWPAGDGWHPL